MDEGKPGPWKILPADLSAKKCRFVTGYCPYCHQLESHAIKKRQRTTLDLRSLMDMMSSLGLIDHDRKDSS